MSHERIRPLLNDYLDGELAPATLARVEDHLGECDLCAAEVASLGALLDETQRLPREMLPPRDLWEGIEARLQERRTEVLRLPQRPSFTARPWMMAAAALLLVALSSAVTLMLVRGPAAAPGVAVGPGGTGSAPAGTALAAFEPTEAEFVRTAAELRQALEGGRSVLLPETIEALESSLEVIDGAIAEARQALEADPNNRALTLLLAGVHREKVELLQRALHFDVRS
jgi:anti-sigma factor RsiW